MKPIFVVGNSGSGKSELMMHYAWFLPHIIPGIAVIPTSDRIYLEEAIVCETKNLSPNFEGIRMGRHGKLEADGPIGHRKVAILDGYHLNNVHRQMVLDTKEWLGNPIVVPLVEYTVGPDKEFREGEPLLQTAHSLVELLQDYAMLDGSIIIEIESSVEDRFVRQETRPDPIPGHIFRDIFPDGGGVTQELQLLIERRGAVFERIINNGVKNSDYASFLLEGEKVARDLIRPSLLEGGRESAEGMWGFQYGRERGF